MADKKISDLNNLSFAAASDLFVVVDVDQTETKNITKAQFMGTPGPIGIVSASTANFTTLELTSGATVDEISTDITFAAPSNLQLATSLAIKTYVDAVTVVGVHNQLVGLQGGDTTANELYHLTLTEHDELTDGGITSLHTHSTASVHNALANLQGGDSTADEFYHLSQSIHDGLFSESPTIGLGNSSATNLKVDYGSDVVTIEINLTEEFNVGLNGLALKTGAIVNEISTDGTLAAASATALITQSAAKTYVDTQIQTVISLETLAGRTPLIQGDSTGTIIFDTLQPDSNYSVVGNMVNDVDVNPSLYVHLIRNETASGFDLLLSGELDSSNYEFSWILSRNELSSSSSTSLSSSSSSSSSSKSSSSASQSSSSTSAGAAPIPSWLSGFPDDPDYMEVVIGNSWQPGTNLAEDDLVRLYRVSGTTIWSEDGTNNADPSTNRIRMNWFQVSTTYVALQLSWAYSTGSWYTGWGSNVLTTYATSGSPYTFRDMFIANPGMTVNSSAFTTTSLSFQNNVFKSMTYVTNTMPAHLSGFPLPPDYIQVTIGTVWNANCLVSEDDVVNLYRVQGTNAWTETGTTSATTGNRLFISWSDGGTDTVDINIRAVTVGATTSFYSGGYVNAQLNTTKGGVYPFQYWFSTSGSFYGYNQIFTTSNNFNFNGQIFKTLDFISG